MTSSLSDPASSAGVQTSTPISSQLKAVTHKVPALFVAIGIIAIAYFVFTVIALSLRLPWEAFAATGCYARSTGAFRGDWNHRYRIYRLSGYCFGAAGALGGFRSYSSRPQHR